MTTLISTFDKVTARTIVGNIDVQGPYYDQKAASGVALDVPGDAAGMTMSPAQFRFLINGIHANANAENNYMTKNLEEVIHDERLRCGLTSRQANFSMLAKYTAEANSAFVNESMTEAQHKTVADLLGAMNGGQPHWDIITNNKIVNLSPYFKQALSEMLFKCETRGQFTTALSKAQALVGNPAANNRTASQPTEKQELDNIAADVDAEAAFAD
jgi:hypothetical protein